MNQKELPFITKSHLEADLHSLGLRPNQTILLHASIKSIGWIVGGPDTIIRAILDILAPNGTLMMLGVIK
jgi:aminoglycoside 3-N-acetyltransferase